MTNYLHAQVPYKRGKSYERLGMSKGLPPLSQEQAPKFEFKPLSNHLKYAFLEEKEILLVIVNATLDKEKLDKLLQVLGSIRRFQDGQFSTSKELGQPFACTESY